MIIISIKHNVLPGRRSDDRQPLPVKGKGTMLRVVNSFTCRRP
jgi:hypothetical protein